MNALDYILAKFKLESSDQTRLPIEIPNFGRNGLALLFAELSFESIVELGVEQGVYSEILCQANPQAKVFLIDAWKAYRGYRDHVSQDKLDGFFEITQERVAKYGNAHIIRGFSMDVVKKFPDNTFDAVYLDGNHKFQYFANDLAEWHRKVKPGGIVCGHDYKIHKNSDQFHVVQVLHAWIDAYNIRPWFVLGRKEIVENEVRDGSRSWMYVKEER